MAEKNVLVVEDEELMRSILRQLLERDGFTVLTADSAETALEIFASANVSVTLTDIKMAGRGGLELLSSIRSIDAYAPVVVMTAYSSVETAVEALRRGAYDYIVKPFVNEDLVQTVRNAAAFREMASENRMLKQQLRRTHGPGAIVGSSPAIKRLIDLINKVAVTNANVLIQGESGTGKELVARAVHLASSRSERPFLPINCAALPEGLLESELFGHTSGAFTGAQGEKAGLFRSAARGSIFLDEVGDMPASVQVKLLRAIQEREVTPVGGSVPIKFDARIIAATNKRLDDEVKSGRFREDLFYRLNVVEIEVPPLRERRDDIPLLAKHFIAKTAASHGTAPRSLTPAAALQLAQYNWPGNVRELEHVLERAVILGGDEIDLDALPAALSEPGSNASTALETVERSHIFRVLETAGGDKAEAARLLEIDLSTLYRKLKRYGAEDHFEVSSSTK